ncbi:hypothetical protein AB0G35_35435 [Streptomyces sp. NPDC021749]|uniref:hypothetical protein n=1 Tax=Streptomyces sp. NPDC021749 TaxID=3154905 RepID=UPI0033F3F5D9
MDEENETGTTKKEKRIDLSVAQVAGSALAAAVAAYLAGQLGVYGTIIGAGLVSVVATTGGSIFQHLFRRTGEQIKEASVSTRPRPRRSSARTRSTTRQARQPDPTMVLPTFDKQGTEDHVTSVAAETSGPDAARTQVIPRAEQARRRDPANAHPADRTRLMPRLGERATAPVRPRTRPEAVTTALPPAGPPAGRPEEVSAATYGTRLRGWKRPALGALAVFVLAMGGVTATELLTGQTAGGRQGTTLGNLTDTGSTGRHQPVTPQSPGPGHTPGDGGRRSGDGATPDPGRSGDTGDDHGTDHGSPSPTPSPSDGGKTSPDPEKSPSGEPSPSGSADSGDTGSGDDAAGGEQGSPQNGSETEAGAPEPGAS